MPPKPKKSPGGTETPTLENIDALSNYGIFFLYFEEQTLQLIAQQFIEDVRKRSRRVIVGITHEEMMEELKKIQENRKFLIKSVQSEGKKDKSKSSDSAGKKNDTGKQTPGEVSGGEETTFEYNFDEFLALIFETINKQVRMSDILQNVVKNRKQFNLLEYWLQTDTTKKPVKKGDEKKSARSKGGAEKKSKDGSVKGKSSKESGSTIPCSIKDVSYVQLDSKVFSKFQPRIYNILPVKEKYIEDQPLERINTYIVFIGKFENNVFYELIRNGFPILGIYYFLLEKHRPANEEQAKSIEILNDIDELTHADKLRNVAISVQYMNPLSKCRVDTLRNAIYDELSFLLYDEETMRKQYNFYLENLIISNVSEKNPCPILPINLLKDIYLPENAMDDITVPIYLDTLLDLVHENSLENTLFTEEDNIGIEEQDLEQDPFIANFCDSTVIEHSNDILKNTIASEIYVGFYQKAIRMLKICSNIKAVFKHYLQQYECQEFYEAKEKDIETRCEPLSEDTLLQKWILFIKNSDQMESFYNPFQRYVHNSFDRYIYVLEKEIKTFTLRTRICFRDFLKFIAPTIQQWLKNQEHIYEVKKSIQKLDIELGVPSPSITRRDFYRRLSLKEIMAQNEVLPNPNDKTISTQITKDEIPNDQKPFAGYNLGEDIIRLLLLKAKYKSGRVQLKLERHIWDFSPNRFRLKLLYRKTIIFFSKVQPSNYNVAKLRIETHDFIITFDHMPPEIPSYKKKYISNENQEFQEIVSYPYATMTWPGLLRIENLYDPITEQLTEIRQYSWRKSIPEKKRFIYSDGTVLVFFLSGLIHVLTANGTMYECGPPLNVLQAEDQIQEEEENSTTMMRIYQNELNYIKRFRQILDCENYIITTGDGHNFRVQGGQIVKKNHQFLTVEWYDYFRGERYSSREDGVKTLTSYKHFLCYYPDGTLITSVAKDEILYASRKDDGRDSFIILPKSDPERSAVMVTKSIVKELINIASDDLFVFISASHLIQHECYATVHFIKEDRVDVYSPGSVNLSFTGKEVNFDLGAELSLLCKEDECIIREHRTAGKNDVGEDLQLQCTINFKEDKLPVFTLKKEHDIITVAADFIWKFSTQKNTEEYFSSFHDDKGLMMQDNAEGFELHSDRDLQTLINTTRKRKGALYYKLDDIEVLLEPLELFDNIYRLPISNLKTFLAKFEINDFKCEIDNSETPKKQFFCDKLNKFMTVSLFYYRTFFRIEKMNRTLYQSAVNFLARQSLGRTYGKKVHDKRNLIAHAIRRAKKYADRSIKKAAGHEQVNLIWKEKRFQHFIQCKMGKLQRRKVYQSMFHNKIFPKYREFVESGGHIKEMNIVPYAEKLGIDYIPQDNLPDQCILKSLELDSRESSKLERMSIETEDQKILIPPVASDFISLESSNQLNRIENEAEECLTFYSNSEELSTSFTSSEDIPCDCKNTEKAPRIAGVNISEVNMSAGGSNSTLKSVTIKKEPLSSNGIDGVGRLSSFSLPRDLTLGGAGPLRGRGGANKKVYTPNLNVTRNKNTNVKTSKDVSARGRSRPERGRSDRGGRGGRGGRAGLIQTAGIFSEGAGSELTKRASSSYRSSWTDRDDSSNAVQKPTLVKGEGRIDVAAEEQHIKDILGDRMDDDFDDKKTDFIDLENIPVKLSEAKWNTSNVKIEKVEVGDKLKTEIGEDGDIEDKVNALKLKPDVYNYRYPLSTEEFFTRSQAQLFLLQLPDSLPCQDEVPEKDVPSTSKDSDTQIEQQTQFSSSSLRSLEEGQIGKLVRYKSGRQQLVLGNTRFDLGLGMETGFLQEVMSITTNREERSGNMVNLGPINAKITAIPDWESLFKGNS